jgi:membrane dipeptidase
LAGNTRYAAIGSDLDGAFGTEQCPYDLETIADIQKVDVLLKKRGYTDQDVENIFSGNVINFMRSALS